MMLDKLSGTYSTEITVGLRKFGLIANAVFNDEGERIGTVVEWNDVTLERAAEDDIAVVVGAISNGDFSTRIDETGKAGFMLNIATSGMVSLIFLACSLFMVDFPLYLLSTHPYHEYSLIRGTWICCL